MLFIVIAGSQPVNKNVSRPLQRIVTFCFCAPLNILTHSLSLTGAVMCKTRYRARRS